MSDLKFSEETFDRLMQNGSIWIRSLETAPRSKSMPNLIILQMELVDAITRDMQQMMEMMGMYESKFRSQFKPGTRRVCENPNCMHTYAYFYDDFLYCPKCGTKLKDTDNKKE